MATWTPTIDSVSESFRGSIPASVDIPCVEGNSDVNRLPSGIYATALLIASRQDGTAVANRNNTASVREHVLQYSVQFYRDGAFQRACEYKAFMESGVHEYDGLFDYFRSSDVQRLDTVISLEFEERAQLTVEIRVVFKLDDAVDSVATSGINVDIEEIIDNIQVRN